MKNLPVLLSVRHVAFALLALLATACGKKEAAPPPPAAVVPTMPAPATVTPAKQDGPTLTSGNAAKALQNSLTPVTGPSAPSVGSPLPNVAPQVSALATQATALVSQYSGELETLTSGAKKLKGLLDQHATMLPAGVKQKYDELNTLLPQLNSMLTSLRAYQNADLTTLLPKLKTDFGKAQQLYQEALALVPAGMRF